MACQNFPNGAGSNGSAGGHAVRIDGDVNLTIENVSGKIWGGGGGGGCGSNSYRVKSTCEPGAGVWGGGGTGGIVTGESVGGEVGGGVVRAVDCTRTIGEDVTDAASGAAGYG